MDTDLTRDTSKITVASVAETLQKCVGDRYADSADVAGDTHLEQTLFAQIRISNETNAGQSYVLQFRPRDIADSSIPVPCKACGNPIPETRLEALDYAATHCIQCKEALEQQSVRRR